MASLGGLDDKNVVVWNVEEGKASLLIVFNFLTFFFILFYKFIIVKIIQSVDPQFQLMLQTL